MIFSPNQLWSCAFGFWTYESKSLGPGTQSRGLGLGLKHLSLDNKCDKQYLKTYLFSLSFWAHSNAPFYNCVKPPLSSGMRHLRRFYTTLRIDFIGKLNFVATIHCGIAEHRAGKD